MAALEPIKDNEEAVKAYGIHLGTEMCKKIMAHGIKTLHLYTLNMEKSALAILMVLLIHATSSLCYCILSIVSLSLSLTDFYLRLNCLFKAHDWFYI